MAKCMNTECPYHLKGGCDLFPGEQWRKCLRSAPRPAVPARPAKPRTTRKGKAK